MTNSTLTCGASVGLQPYRRTQGILIRCGALLCSFDCGNVANDLLIGNTNKWLRFSLCSKKASAGGIWIARESSLSLIRR
jgi:hypothetical protein